MDRTVKYVLLPAVLFRVSWLVGSCHFLPLQLGSSVLWYLHLVKSSCFVRNPISIVILHSFLVLFYDETHDYPYTVFSMPKAERRRWVEIHLSRDRDTPTSLMLKAKTRNKKRTRHRKFVSSEDDNALVPFPTYDHLLEEDQPLLGPHQNSYLDDNDSDQGSADWDWGESMADGVDEAGSTTSLFGAGQWTSTWPSKTVMEIMDALNVSVLVLFMVAT